MTPAQRKLLMNLDDGQTVIHGMRWGVALFNPKRWPEVVDAPIVNHKLLGAVLSRGWIRPSKLYAWFQPGRAGIHYELSPLGRRALREPMKRLSKGMAVAARDRLDRDQKETERIQARFDRFVNAVHSERSSHTPTRPFRVQLCDDSGTQRYRGDIDKDIRTLLRQAFRLAVIRDARKRERAR